MLKVELSSRPEINKRLISIVAQSAAKLQNDMSILKSSPAVIFYYKNMTRWSC